MKVKPCEACGKSIAFLRTRKGGWMPVDAETVDMSRGGDQVYDRNVHRSHFDTCSDPNRFSRRREEDAGARGGGRGTRW